MDTKLPYYTCVVLINVIELRILYQRTKGFRRMKLTADYITTSISLADLITGINGVIVYSLYAAEYPVPMLGRRVGFQFSLATSAMNVTFLTADRLLMIFAPFRHRVWLNREKLIRLLGLIWVVSLVITASAILADELTGYVVFRYVLAAEVLPTNVFLAVSYPLMYWKIRYCRVAVLMTDTSDDQKTKITQSAPVGITDETSSYITNVQVLEKETTIDVAEEARDTIKQRYWSKQDPVKTKQLKEPPTARRGRKEKKVLIFGILISLAFGVCLLPATTCYLIWGSPLKGGKKYFDIAFTLRSLNCILNPIIYLLYQYVPNCWQYIGRTACFHRKTHP